VLNPLSLLGPDDFQQAALNLLPRGAAWPRDLSSILAKAMGAIGDMFARAHADITQITDVELYPPSTSLLLPEWERDYGLPEPCTPQPQTIEQRIQALMAKITDQGSLSRQKFIDLAAALGFTITITEFLPSSGIGTCIGPCTEPVYGMAWRFAWQVNAPATTVGVLTCNGDCVSPLRWWGNENLECVIARRNRPSRFVLFSYAG
jgi:uncharacterized protein YmfQ (DUF2313 family)